nr:30S ribosomal protein 3, chloroplastic-like [Tanacetum cinerariifolium]
MVDHANYLAQQALRSCLKYGSRQLLGSTGSAMASETWIYRHKLGVVVKPMEKPKMILKYIWMEKNIKIAQSQVKGRKCVKKDFAQQRRGRMKDRGIDLKKLLGISNEEAGLKADIRATIIAVDESKPIDQVSQRPKSLGLGEIDPKTPSPSDSTPPLKFNRSCLPYNPKGLGYHKNGFNVEGMVGLMIQDDVECMESFEEVEISFLSIKVVIVCLIKDMGCMLWHEVDPRMANIIAKEMIGLSFPPMMESKMIEHDGRACIYGAFVSVDTNEILMNDEFPILDVGRKIISKDNGGI